MWKQQDTSVSNESLDDGFLCMSLQVRDAIESVKYIAENMRLQNEAKEVSELTSNDAVKPEFIPHFSCYHSLNGDKILVSEQIHLDNVR